MPLLTLPGSIDGPLVNVKIALSVPLQAVTHSFKRSQPQPVFETFLVDTGASHTLVSSDVIRAWNLTPSSGNTVVGVSTAGVLTRQPAYHLSLFLHGAYPGQGWMHDSVEVTSVDPKLFAGHRYRGLIGRDILNRCILLYNGVAEFTFVY